MTVDLLIRCGGNSHPEIGRLLATKANHHYIPQFYLRGFSASAGRQARVFTFDNETKKSFTTLVRNVGSKRHFNRVDASGVDPNHVEDGMAEIEAEIAPHLRQVIKAQKFPSAAHFNSIMNLMALLSVRNPRMRGVMSGFQIDVVERIMGLSVSSEEIWESQMQRMRDDGVPPNSEISYEEAKKFCEAGDYEILIDQTHLIQQELNMIEPVLEQLSNRNWCFVVAPEGASFITSDDPTALDWKEQPDQPIPYSPGHGLMNTTVSFALSSEVALVGVFEDAPEKLNYVADQVTSLNTNIVRRSQKQIYARDGNFRLHLSDRFNVLGSDLPRILGAA